MQRIIKVIALTLTLALALGAGLARGYLVIDDTGIDYENADLSSAHIGFALDQPDLVVVLDDARFDGSLTAVDFDVPDLDLTDFFGNSYSADIDHIADLQWSGVNDEGPSASFLTSLEATHLNADLDRVMTEYVDAFEALGYEASSVDSRASSVKLLRMTNGDSVVDVRLHARAGDVQATLDVR